MGGAYFRCGAEVITQCSNMEPSYSFCAGECEFTYIKCAYNSYLTVPNAKWLEMYQSNAIYRTMLMKAGGLAP